PGFQGGAHERGIVGIILQVQDVERGFHAEALAIQSKIKPPRRRGIWGVTLPKNQTTGPFARTWETSNIQWPELPGIGCWMFSFPTISGVGFRISVPVCSM